MNDTAPAGGRRAQGGVRADTEWGGFSRVTGGAPLLPAAGWGGLAAIGGGACQLVGFPACRFVGKSESWRLGGAVQEEEVLVVASASGGWCRRHGWAAD